MSHRFIIFLFIALIPLSSFAGKKDCHIEDFAVLKAKIVGSADGDTLKVVLTDQSLIESPHCFHLRNSVRLLNIDTPETHYNAGGKEHSQGIWGELAAERMNQLVSHGMEVELHFGGPAKDNYHRFLAEVVTPKGNLNEIMVKEGFAFPIFFTPQVEQAWKYVELAARAKSLGLGLFSDPEFASRTPREFRISHSGRAEQMLIGNLLTGEIVEGADYKTVPAFLRVYGRDREEMKRTLKKSKGKASQACRDLLLTSDN